MTTRLRLAECGLSAGKKARLHRILYKHGLGNGTALFLPYDQGLERQGFLLRRALRGPDGQ
jgi:fructose-bisphosphate aldolase, class I